MRASHVPSVIGRATASSALVPPEPTSGSTTRAPEGLLPLLGRERDEELALRFRLSPGFVSELRRKLGVPSHRERSIARAQAAVLMLMDRGLSAEQIAEHRLVQRNVGTVRNWIRSWGFPPQKERFRKKPVHSVVNGRGP